VENDQPIAPPSAGSSYSIEQDGRKEDDLSAVTMQLDHVRGAAAAQSKGTLSGFRRFKFDHLLVS